MLEDLIRFENKSVYNCYIYVELISLKIVLLINIYFSNRKVKNKWKGTYLDVREKVLENKNFIIFLWKNILIEWKNKVKIYFDNMAEIKCSRIGIRCFWNYINLMNKTPREYLKFCANFLKCNIRYSLSKIMYIIFFSPSLSVSLIVNNSSSIDCSFRYEILLVMMLPRILVSYSAHHWLPVAVKFSWCHNPGQSITICLIVERFYATKLRFRHCSL